jgi:hypothetical protein
MLLLMAEKTMGASTSLHQFLLFQILLGSAKKFQIMPKHFGLHYGIVNLENYDFLWQ